MANETAKANILSKISGCYQDKPKNVRDSIDNYANAMLDDILDGQSVLDENAALETLRSSSFIKDAVAVGDIKLKTSNKKSKELLDMYETDKELLGENYNAETFIESLITAPISQRASKLNFEFLTDTIRKKIAVVAPNFVDNFLIPASVKRRETKSLKKAATDGLFDENNKEWGEYRQYVNKMVDDYAGDMDKETRAAMKDLYGNSKNVQKHNRRLITKMGEKKWMEVARDAFDTDALNKLAAQYHGGSIDNALKEMYATIVRSANTDDLTKQRSHSIIKFANKEGWIKYHQLTNNSDSPLEIVMGHTINMARQLALYKMFGEQPEKTLTDLVRQLTDRGVMRGDSAYIRNLVANMIGRTENFAESKLAADTLKGVNKSRVGGLVANMGGKILTAAPSARTLLSTGALHLSALTQVFSDPFVMAWRNVMLGESGTRGMMTYFKTLVGVGRKDAIQRAKEAGFILDRVLNTLHSGNAGRFYDEGIDIGKKVNATQNFFYKYNLNDYANESIVIARMEELRFALGRDVDKTWEQLGEDNIYRRMGIRQEEWNAFRAVGSETIGSGDDILKTFNNDKLSLEMQDRFRGMIYQDMRVGIGAPTLAVKAKMNFGTQRGTLPREVLDSVMQLKTFPISNFMYLMYGGLQDGTLNKKHLAISMGAVASGVMLVKVRNYLYNGEWLDSDDYLRNPDKFAVDLARGALYGLPLGLYGDVFLGPESGYGVGGVVDVLSSPATDAVDAFITTGWNVGKGIGTGDFMDHLGEAEQNLNRLGKVLPNLTALKLGIMAANDMSIEDFKKRSDRDLWDATKFILVR